MCKAVFAYCACLRAWCLRRPESVRSPGTWVTAVCGYGDMHLVLRKNSVLNRWAVSPAPATAFLMRAFTCLSHWAGCWPKCAWHVQEPQKHTCSVKLVGLLTQPLCWHAQNCSQKHNLHTAPRVQWHQAKPLGHTMTNSKKPTLCGHPPFSGTEEVSEWPLSTSL